MGHLQYSFQQSVLVIEDSREFEKLIREGLFACNVEYEYCPCVLHEAINALKGSKPDMVLFSPEFKSGTAAEFIEESKKILGHTVPSISLAPVSGINNLEVIDRKLLPQMLGSRVTQMIAESRKGISIIGVPAQDQAPKKQ